jgi:hypothetical protein
MLTTSRAMAFADQVHRPACEGEAVVTDADAAAATLVYSLIAFHLPLHGAPDDAAFHLPDPLLSSSWPFANEPPIDALT